MPETRPKPWIKGWVLVAALCFVAGPAAADDHDPPPPPPAPGAPHPGPNPYPNPAAGEPKDDAEDGPELLRYQACFQKMIDAGVADNAFMKKCLGIADAKPRKPTGPGAPLAREEVAAVLGTATPELRKCYDKLLLNWKDLGKKPAGELSFTLAVARGAAADVAYDAGLSDTGLISCFRDRLKSLTFRKSEADAKVLARWSLVPAGKGAAGTVVLLDKALKLAGAGYGLTSEDVLTVFRKNAPKVRRCYDELVKRKPDAAGAAAVTLVVSPKGKVAKVSFRELTVGDEAFKACVTKELRAWHFPHPRSGADVTVEYPPFEFRPK